MGLKYILLFVYAFISVALFITFDGAPQVWISFFVNAVILAGITGYHVFIERTFSPFLSAYIVFTFLFFLVAPMVQINSFEGVNPAFENHLPYSEAATVFTNFLIALFNLIFFATYVFFKRWKWLRSTPELSKSSQAVSPLLIVSLAILTVLVFFASFNFVSDELTRPAWRRSVFSTVTFLVWKKVFFLVPFAGIILCFQYFKREKKNAVNYVTIIALLVFMAVLLLWFKNPLVEKRNALGPLYISLIFLALPRLFNTNIKSLFFLFFTMIVAFPLSAMFTHTEANFEEILENPLVFFEEMKGGGIASAFNTLNYDAFSNIMATMDRVQYHGYEWGNQLLSAFLFFVPRGLWEDKPISTGELVGNHLIDRYDFTYSNLSNPIVSEGYINFGIAGVIIGAIVLALVLVRFLGWLNSQDLLKRLMAFYLAIHLIFLLRGDFTNGFSYYVGALIGVIVIPKTIEALLKHFLRKQQQWKHSKTLKA